ncbi:TetR/AcrR family transcriptional regulator [Catenuloplanes japonicus]|uniref:TetR/AcrR family transcriptional regulator n=1 Tax=Catenuloplanes japonicus TaxID=33876 RepID=UPI000AC617E0|nr:TetR family transcriptional regulator [Catenuloplanes japonicus]
MSSPARRRIDEIGDESRRRILDAAEDLFAERGVGRTSFVDIAARSGISRGSIPWHFKNKDGLVLAVLERAVERSMPPERYTSMTTLTALFEDAAGLLRTRSSALFLMFLAEAATDTGVLRAQYQEFAARRRAGLEVWLRAQRPSGLDPAAAEKRERAFAATLNGALMGIHLQAVIDPESFDPDEAMRALATLVDRNVPDIWA